MALPYGWTDGYAVNYLYEENASLKRAVEGLSERLAYLESEIARLDVTKANRAGRKPKAEV